MILTDSAHSPVAAAPSASVVVPSFGRPEQLRICLTALAAQSPRPLDVVVVARTGDADTASEAAAHGAGLTTVEARGHLPPLAAGVAAAAGEVVAFLDDDCEPWPGWLAALLRHYHDADVGGVGGLVSQPATGRRSVSADVCRISPLGRFDRLGGQKVPSTWGARDADVLLGGNMSYRRELLLGYPWDARVNRGAATDYEVDLAAWVRRHGLRLVYDPDAIVTHHLAPRPELGRTWDEGATADYSHNLVYVSGKALRGPQRLAALAHAFLVGSRASYGVATAVADTIAGRPPSWQRQLRPALVGKLSGLRSLRAYASSGVEPLDGHAPQPAATAMPPNAK